MEHLNFCLIQLSLAPSIKIWHKDIVFSELSINPKCIEMGYNWEKLYGVLWKKNFAYFSRNLQ